MQVKRYKDERAWDRGLGVVDIGTPKIYLFR
jgi:hypothetical protein